MKSTDVSGSSSYRPRCYRCYFSKGTTGRACYGTRRDVSASRRIGSTSASSSYYLASSDTDSSFSTSTFSSSGTSESTYSGSSTGYDSDSYSNDESSDSLSDTEYDSNTSTDRSTYCGSDRYYGSSTKSDTEYDSNTSTDGSSYFRSDSYYGSNAKSRSSKKSSPTDTNPDSYSKIGISSTDTYYSGDYSKRHGFQTYSGRKRTRSSMNGPPTRSCRR